MAESTAPPAGEADPDGLAMNSLDPCPSKQKVIDSLSYYPGAFHPLECHRAEAWINDTAWRASCGFLPGSHTVDSTLYRTKYFFGKGYTYGGGRRGKEELLSEDSVDEIPAWLYALVIRPLEGRGYLPPGWIDSVVLNDYRFGGSIVAHVDPPKLFARPIFIVSFFDPGRLVFGASFDPGRSTPPIYSQQMDRGSLLVMDGYSANSVTHGMRPEDLLGARRVGIVLRHVLEDAPRVKEVSSKPGDWMELIQRVQGKWRDPPSASFHGKFYSVRGLVVTVVSWQGFDFQGKSDSQARTDTWELELVPEGLICHGGFLASTGVSATGDSLHWTDLRNLQDEAYSWKTAQCQAGFTWVRMEN